MIKQKGFLFVSTYDFILTAHGLFDNRYVHLFTKYSLTGHFVTHK